MSPPFSNYVFSSGCPCVFFPKKPSPLWKWQNPDELLQSCFQSILMKHCPESYWRQRVQETVCLSKILSKVCSHVAHPIPKVKRPDTKWITKNMFWNLRSLRSRSQEMRCLMRTHFLVHVGPLSLCLNNVEWIGPFSEVF